MPRYEYIDDFGDAHVVTADDLSHATELAWRQELKRTGLLSRADKAAGTVEASDERSRAA